MIASPSAAATEDSFQAGVVAVRAGDFELARERFIEARAQGNRTGRLFFNLGVVYYKLKQFPEATDAFERASKLPETRDISIYNIGLVALASGDLDTAIKFFDRTRREAKSQNLKILAARALRKAQGRKPVAGVGSLSVLRAEDSNVVLPAGSIADTASDREDGFTEVRAIWIDSFDRNGRWGYRVTGLGIEYDDLSAADIAYAELAFERRGRFTVQLAGSGLLVADRGYQRTIDLRVKATIHNSRPFRLDVESGIASLEALSGGPEQLSGTRYFFGTAADLRLRGMTFSLSGRQTYNDRERADLSPEQSTVALQLRSTRDPWSLRVSFRYQSGKYPTERKDELTEVRGELGFRLFPSVELIVEAAEVINRSNIRAFEYDAARVYGGVRFRF